MRASSIEYDVRVPALITTRALPAHHDHLSHGDIVLPHGVRATASSSTEAEAEQPGKARQGGPLVWPPRGGERLDWSQAAAASDRISRTITTTNASYLAVVSQTKRARERKHHSHRNDIARFLRFPPTASTHRAPSHQAPSSTPSILVILRTPDPLLHYHHHHHYHPDSDCDTTNPLGLLLKAAYSVFHLLVLVVQLRTTPLLHPLPSLAPRWNMLLAVAAASRYSPPSLPHPFLNGSSSSYSAINNQYDDDGGDPPRAYPTQPANSAAPPQRPPRLPSCSLRQPRRPHHRPGRPISTSTHTITTRAQ